MELGSGTGIVSVIASLLGGNVVATDIASVIPILSKNISSHLQYIQAGGGVCNAEIFDWTSVHNFSTLPKVDVVLGSDLVYSMNQIEPLCAVLQTLVSRHPTVEILLVHKDRNTVLSSTFLCQCKEAGVEFKLLNVDCNGSNNSQSTNSVFLQLYHCTLLHKQNT